MVTVDGKESGGRGITAQVCNVHRPLMSVKRVCKAGYRVVFDDDCSYVEDKVTGETMKVIEEDGEYVIDTWVKTDDPRTTDAHEELLMRNCLSQAWKTGVTSKKDLGGETSVVFRYQVQR